MPPSGSSPWRQILRASYATLSPAPRKGNTVSGWTMERGDRDARGTETLSVHGVSRGSLGCPGARRASRSYISAAWGNTTSPGVIHYGFTTTVYGRRPRWMSPAKARTFPSSGFSCAKDGVTN